MSHNPAGLRKNIDFFSVRNLKIVYKTVSAFFMECKQKKIKLNGSIQTKSKYLGMSISVELIGECNYFYRLNNFSLALILKKNISIISDTKT